MSVHLAELLGSVMLMENINNFTLVKGALHWKVCQRSTRYSHCNLSDLLVPSSRSTWSTIYWTIKISVQEVQFCLLALKLKWKHIISLSLEEILLGDEANLWCGMKWLCTAAEMKIEHSTCESCKKFLP